MTRQHTARTERFFPPKGLRATLTALPEGRGREATTFCWPIGLYDLASLDAPTISAANSR